MAALGVSVWAAVVSIACAQVNFTTANFNAQFADGSGVLQSLVSNDFDFSPSDVFSDRNGVGNYHTGDLNLRFRQAGATNWTVANTATSRDATTDELTSSLNAALPAAGELFNVSRTWSDLNGDLALTFEVLANEAIEIGGMGFPIEFNNIFTGRMAVDTTNLCVVVDPYIGLDAGYVQVTRLTGTGPNLVITPLNQTKFEAWNFLSEPSTPPLYYQSQAFEGNYEWLAYSEAYTAQDWNASTPWNPPTSVSLNAGDTATFGLRFSVALSLPEIEDTVTANSIPYAIGIPGYILTEDLTSSLYLNYKSAVSSISIDPADSVTFTPVTSELPTPWVGYSVQASDGSFGRVRATVHYEDGSNQTVHYDVQLGATKALDNLGTFAATRQLFNDTTDPFHRAPSIISFDSSTNDFVLQDNRAWIAGLSDEGGAGSFVAASMKQTADPVPSEVALLEQFVQGVVWGYLQLYDGAQKYGVRKSLFYYEPESLPDYPYDESIDFSGTWNKSQAYLLNRAYDYVWVSELYWSLYTAEVMSPGILTIYNATWYLNQSYNTVMYALDEANDVGYANLGLMGETVWGSLLDDLYLENMTDEASSLSTLLQARQKVWAGQADPYGSEMAWDSTGEEGVYYWSAYYNDSVTADKTLAAIRGYMPTIPHWGYNGNARRYWDFQYAGSPQLARVERQIHHYGSGLNSPPLLANYRTYSDPSSADAIYDLRVGYGGHQGPLSNIQADGFVSMAFHSYANTLEWDAYTGDYGPGFLGHVLAAACYIVDHPTFGTVAFGGNIQSTDSSVTVQPRDSVRRRVYLAPVGLWITLDAGQIQQVAYDAATKSVSVDVAARGSQKTDVVMKFEQTAQMDGVGTVHLKTQGLQQSRGGYLVSIPSDGPATVEFGI